ncbi:Biotin/lipoate A/B protein ligase, partial [Cladochytrium tenue]
MIAAHVRCHLPWRAASVAFAAAASAAPASGSGAHRTLASVAGAQARSAASPTLAFNDPPPPVAECYISTVSDPWVNLAFEEWLFQRADASTPSNVLYLWRNMPCVVIGTNQDLGNTNFTAIMSRDDFKRTTYAEMAARALRDRLDIPATVSERHDVLVDGKKVSGSAYKVERSRAYHHGTMLIDSDIKSLGMYLRSGRHVKISVKAGLLAEAVVDVDISRVSAPAMRTLLSTAIKAKFNSILIPGQPFDDGEHAPQESAATDNIGAEVDEAPLSIDESRQGDGHKHHVHQPLPAVRDDHLRSLFPPAAVGEGTDSIKSHEHDGQADNDLYAQHTAQEEAGGLCRTAPVDPELQPPVDPAASSPNSSLDDAPTTLEPACAPQQPKAAGPAAAGAMSAIAADRRRRVASARTPQEEAAAAERRRRRRREQDAAESADAAAERERLAAVKATGVLDGLHPGDRSLLDAVTLQAARLLGAELAVLSIVDASRVVWVSAIERTGRSLVQEPQDAAAEYQLPCEFRDESFCSLVVRPRGRGGFVVLDAAADPRFRRWTEVRSGLRFYAGAAIEINGTSRVGVLSVRGSPRQTFGPAEVTLLKSLAEWAAAEVELIAARSAQGRASLLLEGQSKIQDILSSSLGKLLANSFGGLQPSIQKCIDIAASVINDAAVYLVSIELDGNGEAVTSRKYEAGRLPSECDLELPEELAATAFKRKDPNSAVASILAARQDRDILNSCACESIWSGGRPVAIMVVIFIGQWRRVTPA